MQLLILNPNTSESVTERLRSHVAAQCGSEVTLRTATARFGASYIADETSYAIAAHAALDAYAAHCEACGDPDAVLLGCFGDPGVAALHELSGKPVVGLAEAAMCEAAGHGRYTIVTGGAAWKPMLKRLARTFGCAEALARVHTVAPSGAQLAADPAGAIALLREACREAAQGVDAVVLGGAGLAGMAAVIAPDLDVPLIDSVSAGAKAVLREADAGAPAMRCAAEWRGLSEALLRRLR